MLQLAVFSPAKRFVNAPVFRREISERVLVVPCILISTQPHTVAEGHVIFVHLTTWYWRASISANCWKGSLDVQQKQFKVGLGARSVMDLSHGPATNAG